MYNEIYPTGSQPAKINSLPKIHKARAPGTALPFRPIVSYIGPYNYNLAKYLCWLLVPFIQQQYTAQDTFSFIRGLSNLSTYGHFMVSFDAESLFTNILLEESIDLAVKDMLKGNSNLKLN